MSMMDNEADFLKNRENDIMDACDGECSDECPCVNCDEHPRVRRIVRGMQLRNEISIGE